MNIMIEEQMLITIAQQIITKARLQTALLFVNPLNLNLH